MSNDVSPASYHYALIARALEIIDREGELHASGAVVRGRFRAGRRHEALPAEALERELEGAGLVPWVGHAEAACSAACGARCAEIHAMPQSS